MALTLGTAASCIKTRFAPYMNYMIYVNTASTSEWVHLQHRPLDGRLTQLSFLLVLQYDIRSNINRRALGIRSLLGPLSIDQPATTNRMLSATPVLTTSSRILKAHCRAFCSRSITVTALYRQHTYHTTATKRTTTTGPPRKYSKKSKHNTPFPRPKQASVLPIRTTRTCLTLLLKPHPHRLTPYPIQPKQYRGQTLNNRPT